MTLAVVDHACHFCRRTENDLVGRLKAITSGSHAGTYACDQPDRDECIVIAGRRLRRKGRRR